MDNIIQKCSLKAHKDIDAISYCQECKIYICNKCEKHHSELFNDSHHQYKLDKDTTDIFTGLCKEKNHLIELSYFCITHNKLCCAKCITKIKYEEDGQHSDCKICPIKDIENEKRNKLKNIIKDLEKLSINLEQSIIELKKILEENNEKKEALKVNIQKIFTKLRNALNDREDQLLLDVDKQYNDKFYYEDIIKKTEKLPKKVKASLEKGKLIDEQWKNENNKINSLINDCLNIENNINEINDINNKKEKINSLKIEFEFQSDSKEINELLNEIKKFGKLELERKYKIDSKIINKKEEIELLEKRLTSKGQNKNAIFNLLYRASRDGDDPKIYHKKCDGKANTICLIQTIKGCIFGGYTEVMINSNESDYKDPNSFVFSFNKMKIYENIKKDKEAVNHSSTWGPIFRSDAFAVWDKNFFSYNKHTVGTKAQSNFGNMDKDYEINNGEQYFSIKELEVFQIIIE